MFVEIIVAVLIFVRRYQRLRRVQCTDREVVVRPERDLHRFVFPTIPRLQQMHSFRNYPAALFVSRSYNYVYCPKKRRLVRLAVEQPGTGADLADYTTIPERCMETSFHHKSKAKLWVISRAAGLKPAVVSTPCKYTQLFNKPLQPPVVLPALHAVQPGEKLPVQGRFSGIYSFNNYTAGMNPPQEWSSIPGGSAAICQQPVATSNEEHSKSTFNDYTAGMNPPPVTVRSSKQPDGSTAVFKPAAAATGGEEHSEYESIGRCEMGSCVATECTEDYTFNKSELVCGMMIV